jgi:hypothetical protein
VGDSESAGLEVLEAAYRDPVAAAQGWRSQGGQVVGLFGRYAARELVSAAGLLPVRLQPSRLPDSCASDEAAALPGNGPVGEVLAGLRGELSEEGLAVLGSLLSGRLAWIDALLIGRDSEAHTKLFYVLRELAVDRELGSRVPRFAFCDVLRLPLRTSAVYNRRRMRQLFEALAGWGGGAPDTKRLELAIAAEVRLAERLGELERLRVEGRIPGSDVRLAVCAAQVLPADQTAAALEDIVARARRRPAVRHEMPIFVTGSEADPEVYRALESAGAFIVGDDHGWHDGAGRGERSDDPFSWLADQYQFSTRGAARSGLDRVAAVGREVRAAGAAAVVQIILPGDEASEWELAELRALNPDVPVVSLPLSGRASVASIGASAAEALGAIRPSADPTRGGPVDG